MKNLKEYIKESILDDWEDIDFKKDIKSEIKQFLKDNYYGRFSMTLVEGKYIVNSKASVDIKNINITSLSNGMFEFGKVRGFNCSYCNFLTSLEGAPKEVGEDFSCAFCNSLKTLEGAPEIVGGDFICRDCKGQFTEKDVTDVCNVKGKINI